MSALTRAIEGRNAPSEPTPPLHTGDIAYDAIGEVWLYQPVDYQGPHELVPAAKIGGGGAEVGPTPPDSPNEGDFWWNTSTTPDQLFIFAGGAWQPVAAPTDLSGVLHLTGGTMTGPITLAGNATQPLQPTTLQQMTAAITSAPFLPLAGGTLTGNLAFNSPTGTGQIQFQNAGVAEATLGADSSTNRMRMRDQNGNDIQTWNWVSQTSQFWANLITNGMVTISGGLTLNNTPTSDPGNNQAWNNGGFLSFGTVGTLTLLGPSVAINLNDPGTSGTPRLNFSQNNVMAAAFTMSGNRLLTIMDNTNTGNGIINFSGTNRNINVYGSTTFNSTLLMGGSGNMITLLANNNVSGIAWQAFGTNFTRIVSDNNNGRLEIQDNTFSATNPIMSWNYTSTNRTTQVWGPLVLSSVPTANPHVVGQVWNNAGVLNISAG